MSTRRSIFLSAALALAASPAFASSIPQMNRETYPGQLFWLAVSFVLLYLIVSQFVAPRIAGVLNARDSAINEAIAKAEELKAKATGTRGDFEAAGNEARAKAAAAIGKAQADAAKKAADAFAELGAELDAKAQQARGRIDTAMNKAQGELDSAAQSLADAMTDKLLSAKQTAKPAKKAS